jgi:hypothetical protein
MALSDAQADRRPFRRRLETRPPPVLDLPQLPGSPFLHAVLTTPVDQLRCTRRLLSSLGHTAFPAMQTGRHPQLTFEACSSFTHVTACRIAHPPFVGFITRLRPAPVSRSRTLASYQVLPTTAWVGPSPTGVPRLWGALHRLGVKRPGLCLGDGGAGQGALRRVAITCLRSAAAGHQPQARTSAIHASSAPPLLSNRGVELRQDDFWGIPFCRCTFGPRFPICVAQPQRHPGFRIRAGAISDRVFLRQIPPLPSAKTSGSQARGGWAVSAVC